jgi:hypothetical protein
VRALRTLACVTPPTKKLLCRCLVLPALALAHPLHVSLRKHLASSDSKLTKRVAMSSCMLPANIGDRQPLSTEVC